jgi:DNA-binding winged helix-turn-helix (wHTH) protein/tetratricopeptide (TPR) repeat protein
VGHALHFPPFRLDLVAGQLFRGDEPVALRPKTFSTLCHLAERPGALVTKDELLAAVWPGVAVTEDMPRLSVRELRRALGDDPAAPRFIETVHGRGYRFLGGTRPATVAASARDRDGRAAPEGPIVVGRESELATLGDWLARAETGERVVGFLAGDAGIGKTTLVDAFLAQAAPPGRDVLVARGECREVVDAWEPYRPLLEALHALAAGPARQRIVASLRAHAPTWLAQLPSLLDAAEAAALRQQLHGSTGVRMVREFAGWVEAVTADVPLLLVLEDLHWSDRASLDVLVALAHGRIAARLLVLGTYRPVDAIVAGHPLRAITQELGRKRLCREVMLSALTRGAVQAYLAARFAPGGLGAELVDFVHERSDGNPFFMTAVADQLVRERLLVRRAERWEGAPAAELRSVGIPDTLREMVERQLESLDQDTLAVLEVASVVGVEFAAPAAAAALADPAVEEVEDACDRLVRQGRLLRFLGENAWPDGTAGARYGFRHSLYRDVLYDRIPPSRRQRLHQVVGERLERARAGDCGPIAAELGAHFQKSHDRARAVEYLRQAADVAQKRFADREAIAYLERALALLETMPPSDERTQQELLLRLLLAPSLTVATGHASPELEASSGRVRLLLADLGDTPAHLFALLALFTFELMRGRLDAATEIAERALDLGPRVAPVFANIGVLAAAVTACYRGEFERARRHFEAALAGETPEVWPISFDLPSVAMSHLADRCLVYLGFPEQAVARGEETLARADRLGHPFQQAVAKSTIARMYVVLREPHRARDLGAECLRLCAEHGFPDIAHRTAIVVGWARAVLGETDAVDELPALLEVYPTRAGMVAVTSAHLTVVEAMAAVGRLDEGLRLALEAGRRVEETGERMEEAEVHRWRGELLLALRGRQAWPEARACFERALATARAQAARWFELRAAASLARLSAEQGRRPAARNLLAEALGGFTEGHDRLDLVEARRLLERLR